MYACSTSQSQIRSSKEVTAKFNISKNVIPISRGELVAISWWRVSVWPSKAHCALSLSNWEPAFLVGLVKQISIIFADGGMPNLLNVIKPPLVLILSDSLCWGSLNFGSFSFLALFVYRVNTSEPTFRETAGLKSPYLEDFEDGRD